MTETEKKLNSLLRNEAVRLGACGEVMNLWKEDLDMSGLIGLFKSPQGFEFCCQKGFPSSGFILSNFPIEMLHFHGIFVEEDVTGLDIPPRSCFIGGCSGFIVSRGYDVCSFHFSGACDMTLSACDFSKVFCSLSRGARLKVKRRPGAYVYVSTDKDSEAVGLISKLKRR